MWDLPGPGLEPVSPALTGPGLEPVAPALAGGFLTTAPPGKSPGAFFTSETFQDLLFLEGMTDFGPFFLFSGISWTILGRGLSFFGTGDFASVVNLITFSASVFSFWCSCELDVEFPGVILWVP